MRALLRPLGTACCLLFAAPAPTIPAAAAEDFIICRDATGDEAIAACDRAIASKKYSGADLSHLYDNRGVEYSRKALMM